MALLDVRDLQVSFPGKDGPVHALRGVSFSLERGERLGVVGESGAGKSMVAFAILSLIAEPGRITGGDIRFHGDNLAEASPEALRAIRGNRIAMIFQDPMMTLNPVLTIGRQMTEVLHAHRGMRGAAARELAIDKLREVAIPNAEARFDAYPHELSGGLKQRVMIAIALLTDPELIIADEPTTALDVTIQAEIMALMLNLCETREMALILITHDLAVVSETTQRLMVMYAGKAIESGETRAVIDAPAHPYTRGLLHALPQQNQPGGRLNQIPGAMPLAGAIPSGCAFHPRCDHAEARCREGVPELTAQDRRAVACWRAAEFSKALS